VTGQGDPLEEASRGLGRRVAEQDEQEASKRYQDAQLHLERLVGDFVVALRASVFYTTRIPASQQWLMQNLADELLESTVLIVQLPRDGFLNAPRRELRYLLEAAVKYVFVDQQVDSSASLEERVAFLADTTKVPRSSVAPIDEVRVLLVADEEEFRRAVKQSFAALSGYVHPSRRSLEERLQRAERGEFAGFEGPGALEALSNLARRTLDLVLVLLFQGLGPSLTGDLFIHVLDERRDWKFHRTEYCAQVSQAFDYKVERQNPLRPEE
jgi:hypothetical protein